MFNTFCYRLNQRRLAWLAALLRFVLWLLLPAEERTYRHGSVFGYKGWIQSPVGALAFRRDDGTLQWQW